MQKSKGFTLIELLVTIAIIGILSAIILFSITQYINRSKDAAIAGALSSLVPTGEVYYDNNGVDGYSGGIGGLGFCGSSALENANNSISLPADNNCKNVDGKSIICCKANTNNWAACAQEFVNSNRAFCVDSRGIKREICAASCSDSILSCPENTLSACQQPI